MPEPIIEKIRQTRLAALREIKQANGYSWDAEVYANNPTKPPTPLAGRIVLFQLPPSREMEYTGDGANFTKYHITYVVLVYLPPRAQTDERDWDDYIGCVIGDVIKAWALDRQCADPDSGRLMADDSMFIESGDGPDNVSIPCVVLVFDVVADWIDERPDSQDP